MEVGGFIILPVKVLLKLISRDDIKDSYVVADKYTEYTVYI